MTRFLVSDENPGGYKLEDILTALRADVLTRCTKIALDERPEAQHVVANNMEVLTHLTKAIELAQDSTRVLNKAFGPSKAAEGGPPRIGVA
jgi:hypothetical protein